MKKKECDKTTCLIPILFIIYIVLLAWIILFKLQFSISQLDTVRSINLIPFYYKNEVNLTFHLKEVIENIAIFVPFGIYLCMFKHEPGLKIKVVILIVASLILETTQYIMAIGRTDITDLITNICGGLIGIGLHWLLVKIVSSERKADFIITILASVVTIMVVGSLAAILILN